MKVPLNPDPRGLTFTWWGCTTVYVQDINQPSLPTLLFILFFVCFCFYGSFNGISYHKFSRQLSAFSLCSSSLASALLVLSNIYLFMMSPSALI